MTFLYGFALGMGLIISIGAQNIFIIKQAIKRQYSYIAASICIVCDIVLIGISVNFTQFLLHYLPVLRTAFLAAAIIFLVIYGGLSIKSGLSRVPITQNTWKSQHTISLSNIILLALSFSLLNPQALLDTVILIGGVASTYQSTYIQNEFMIGAIVASILWFLGLTYTVRCFSHFLQHDRAWRIIELVSGMIMLAIATHLLISPIYS